MIKNIYNYYNYQIELLLYFNLNTFEEENHNFFEIVNSNPNPV